MSGTLINLLQALQEMLVPTPAIAASPKDPFFAFEFGLPVPEDTFRTSPTEPQLSAGLALEYISNLANVVPRVDAGVYLPTSREIDSIYELLLEGATATTASAMPLVGHLRLAAKAIFDDDVLGSFLPPGVETFHPVRGEPSTWFDPSASGNWTSFRIDQPSQTTHRPLALSLLQWRPAPMEIRPLLAATLSIDTVNKVIAALKAQDGEPPPSSVHHVPPVHHLGGPLPEVVMPLSDAEAVVPLDALDSGKRLHPFPVPVPPIPVDDNIVASTDFFISGEVCPLRLQRRWLSTTFMDFPGWFVPGLAHGSLSKGAGRGDTGDLAVIPITCFLVRNLEITAQWTDADEEHLLAATHLGPLSLIGRSFDIPSRSVRIPGMQVIGWLCDPMSTLPPEDAPAVLG